MLIAIMPISHCWYVEASPDGSTYRRAGGSGPRGNLRTRVHTELGEDICRMPLGGRLDVHKLVSDLSIGVLARIRR